jgi:hypothetical protein
VRYGKPLRFEWLAHSTRAQQQRAADLILARIRALHAELAAQTSAAERGAAR